MSLTQERLEIANRAVRQTFERSSVAWQAIPHWDVGDPGRVRVRSEVSHTLAGRIDPFNPPLGQGPLNSVPVALDQDGEFFSVSVAHAVAPTPDGLLAAVIPRAVTLARAFDDAVLTEVGSRAIATNGPWRRPVSIGAGAPPLAERILTELIEARALLVESGYPAPSGLVVSTRWLGLLNSWQGSYPVYQSVLTGANVNAVHQSSLLQAVVVAGQPRELMLMIGRSAEIPPGQAPNASPGEEPVDLAISVPPGLELVGDDGAGGIELGIRIRFGVRFKDERGVVVLFDGP